MIQKLKDFSILEVSAGVTVDRVLALLRKYFSTAVRQNNFLSKMNYKKIAIGFFCLFMFGIIVGFIGFPALLKKMIKGQIVLKPGGATRALWSKVPFPVDFLVYVFNVTNPDEVINGGKPILQEVGPFVFDEWKDKYDLEDNEEDDTVSYNMRNTFYFRPERSGGLTGEELITMPHPLIMPLSVLVARDRRPMLNLISEGITIIFKDSTAMITAKFMDLFFRGIPVECTSEEFAAKAICLAFHTNQVKGGFPHNETHFKFALFAAANHTDAGRFTVSRGVKNSREVGHVLLFDDEPQLSVWSGDECNKYVGTDSTIFAPFMKKEDGIWAFAADLCRSLGAYYTQKSSYHGISTLRYTMDFGDIKNDEKLHCFCNNPPDDCPVAGTMDLSKCVGGPLVASLPHFYRGDKSLFENVIGLNPNEKDHAIFIDFELMTGSPLSAAKRLQFNLDVEPVPEVDAMKNVRKMILPLFWVEEGASLNKTYTDMMKKTLFLGLKVNQGIRWFSVLVGLIGMKICAYMLYKQKQSRLNVTQNVTEKTGTPNVIDLENKF